MTNKWFHDFSIGWNEWYYWAGVIIVGCLIYGFNNLKVENKKIVVENNKYFLKTLLPAIALFFAVCRESSDGILQYYLNGLVPGEWAGYADVSWAITLIGLIFVAWGVFYVAIRAGEYAGIVFFTIAKFFIRLFRNLKKIWQNRKNRKNHQIKKTKPKS